MNFIRYILRSIIIVWIVVNLFFLWSCNNDAATQISDMHNGGLSFSLVYYGNADKPQHQTSKFDCVSEGIATVEAAVYNLHNAYIVGGGPWDCEEGQGVINSVPVGSNHTIVILGLDSENKIIFRGAKSGVQVYANQDNDAGTVDCYTFVPNLSAPTDGSVVNGGNMKLVWDAVSGAAEYHLVVSENINLSAPLIDEITIAPNYLPKSLPNNQTYFWQVVANDSQKHVGTESPVWSFSVDETHVNTPPVAQIASPSDGSTFTIDDVIHFSGTGVDAEEGNLSGVSLVWNSDIDGLIGEGESVTYSLSEGEHQISLTVIDSEGASAKKTISITVKAKNENAPPEVQIYKPEHGSTFLISKDIVFNGIGTDDEDGEITGPALVWRSDLDGWIGLDATFTKKLSAGTHRITLTATDSEEAVSSKTVAITIATGRLPDTGQDISYTKTPGEDSDYKIHPPIYTKLDAAGNELSSDATSWVAVRDDITGLVWEVKTMDRSWHGMREAYNFQVARTEFIKAINDDNFGGFSDWRLPNIQELISITHKGKETIPLINKDYFPNTLNVANHWTTHLHPLREGLGWVVYFIDGSVAPPRLIEPIVHGVRAVRGEKIESDFSDNGNNTVTDAATGLMWQQTVAGTMTWEEALAYCESLNLAGYDDWRLPNYNELISIVDYTLHSPAIDQLIFTNFPDIKTSTPVYWSSTTYSIEADKAWGVSFQYGDSLHYDKSLGYYVRAVRGWN